MTLLIGAKGRSHMVVASDGRSTSVLNGVSSVETDHLRKIFDAPGCPLAIAAHGENILLGERVGERIRRFFEGYAEALGGMSIRQVATNFLEQCDEDVQETFRKVPDAKMTAFWFCGFSPRSDRPELLELVWLRAGEGGPSLQLLEHGDLVIGGSGAAYIEEFLSKPVEPDLGWERLAGEGPEYATRLVDRLYEIAENRRDAKQGEEFGGDRGLLTISKGGCRWRGAPLAD